MKKCFVIMPFKQQGSPEHAHFRALLDNVLKPTIERFGYEVTRADDHKRVGSITKDIIVPLATADLVVADLTEVNPNVFYELGVRHALRGYGTIMIMDESQTTIPFDVTAYRVIKFRSTLEGIGALGRELGGYVEQLEQDPSAGLKDNLVHDWLPSLPTNVLDSALGSEEGALRRQIQELRRTIAAYEQKFGALSGARDGSRTALQMVEEALAEAKSGLVPATLVDRATSAAQKGEASEFLDAISQLLQLRSSKPTVRHIVELTHAAGIIGLATVSEAILEHAKTLYPNNAEVKLIQFQSLAHSESAASREKARQEMLSHLGITKEARGYSFSKPLSGDIDTGVLSIMLDAFHEDNLHADALSILEKAKELHPEDSRIMRNYARALENIGRRSESLDFYRRANFLPDADDTTAVWFGNELHNRGRYADAAEVYLLACLRDIDDSKNFLHYAEEISRCLTQDDAKNSGKRGFPTEISEPRVVVAQAVVAAVSVGGINPDSLQRMKAALRRADLDFESLQEEIESAGAPAPTSRGQRLQFVREQYQYVRSPLTDPSAEWHA